MKQFRKKPNIPSEEEEENETKYGPHLLLEVNQPTEHPNSFDHTPITPEEVSQVTDTPTSESQDLTYLPPQAPRSRREMQTSRIQAPVPRTRARIMAQGNISEGTSV